MPATNGVGGTVVEINGEGRDGQQQQGKKNAVLGLKAKKIPEHERSTTPYMTKYERARVLGTRALQIRFIMLPFPLPFPDPPAYRPQQLISICVVASMVELVAKNR